jgi:hypothetical protein
LETISADYGTDDVKFGQTADHRKSPDFDLKAFDADD